MEVISHAVYYRLCRAAASLEIIEQEERDTEPSFADDIVKLKENGPFLLQCGLNVLMSLTGVAPRPRVEDEMRSFTLPLSTNIASRYVRDFHTIRGIGILLGRTRTWLARLRRLLREI